MVSPVRSQLLQEKSVPSGFSFPDSTYTLHLPKKNWLGAAGMTVGVNLFVWSFDRFAMNKPYTRINFKTIETNFRKGLIWDNDKMSTNMFSHPYHGNLYYTSARSNGLGYWESGLMSFAGSAMWEFIMESEYPSTNDIIATPVGGMALGEVLYRTSDLIIDDRKSGKERIGREIATFVITPTRGVMRLINGESWKKRKDRGRQFPRPDLHIDVAAGVRFIELEGPRWDNGIGFTSILKIDYGDRFTAETERPYDYFSFRINLNIEKSQPTLGQVNLLGRLYSVSIKDTPKDFLSLGVYQHYDYYDSDTLSTSSSRVPYRFSTPASFGLGLVYQNKRAGDWKFDSFLHLNGIVLGATLSDHYVVKDRDYNLASGFSGKIGFSLGFRNRVSLEAMTETYRLFTWKGYPKNVDWETVDIKTLNAMGDESQATLHTSSLRLNVRLNDKFSFSAVGFSYIRDTNYKYFPDVFSQTYDGRFMITYEFYNNSGN